MRGITKRFAGVVANDNITLQVRPGEIHALLGENGAGKSTLMSILFGLYQPDEGTIWKDGKQVAVNSPNDANGLGIGMVHQHFKLVEVFSVLENIMLGQELRRGGFLEKQKARARVAALSARYGLPIDPDARVEDCTVGMQQRIEILKMLYREHDVLIFDEPTAVLTPQETRELMAIMTKFAGEGKSILFITHKLGEIMEVAHRCTVLRRGRVAGTVDVAGTCREELARLMMGRPLSLQLHKTPAQPGEVVLSVENLTVPSPLHPRDGVRGVTFQVRAGEILCLAGVDGNGQTELVAALTGLARPRSGRVVLGGEDVTRASVARRAALGLGHIPEDRHKHGLVLDFTLGENLALRRYKRPPLSKGGVLSFSAIRAFGEGLARQYDVRGGQGGGAPVRLLSGGNQQKAIIARELAEDPALLVAVQPTRGLDVGAMAYIHRQLLAQRDRGAGVLLVSLELEEVMALADRILVIHSGCLVGELDPQTTTVQELGLYMAGAAGEKGGEEGA